MSDETFTGERLHEGAELFAVDLARHRAAYELARREADELARGGSLLDLGSGSGYGAALLARALDGRARVVGVDRVAPDRASRASPARFLRADLAALPLRPRSFDLVVSFQVIEHLEDPTVYLEAIAGLVRADGLAIVTTPNILQSDGVNPYHVHEYAAQELAERLRPHFAGVEMRGVGTAPPVRAYLEARSRRIRRIMRLDPLGLHHRLPRALVEWLFARFAVLVRSRTRSDSGTQAATWRDFPVGAADDACLDLVALCREPR